MDEIYQLLTRVLSGIVLAGAAVSALLVGLRSVYRQARNIEKVMDLTEKTAADFAEFRTVQLDNGARRDQAIEELQHGMNVMVRELTPNGGSSIKDVVNRVQLDVARLMQWKEDQTA